MSSSITECWEIPEMEYKALDGLHPSSFKVPTMPWTMMEETAMGLPLLDIKCPIKLNKQ